MNLKTKITFPAEWSKQDAILICWPHKSMDWQPILAEVEPVFVQMANHITQHQSLIIIAYDHDHQQAIERQLSQAKAKLSAVKWLVHKNNDTWCRDFGPITVYKDNQPIALDFRFNGWGNKFEHAADDLANQLLKQQQLLTCPLESQNLVLEGGSIESDGIGSLLTTEHCLLSPERNPTLSKTAIEAQLQSQLGVKRVLWLTEGYLEGDDTDSHIDNLARFCNLDTIAYASCDDRNDVHYQSLKAMEDQLKQLRTLDNKPYELIDLNIPQAQFHDGERVPASYVNFLITNKVVLVPIFNDANDKKILAKLSKVFNNREVIGIDSRSLVKQSGSIHCLTMQLPKGTVNLLSNNDKTIQTGTQ